MEAAAFVRTAFPEDYQEHDSYCVQNGRIGRENHKEKDRVPGRKRPPPADFRRRRVEYGSDIMSTPASAPLLSLTPRSMTAYQTSSLRSFRFESQLYSTNK